MILCRTSGCGFTKPAGSQNEEVMMFRNDNQTGTQELSPLVITCLKSIFKKLDSINLDNSVDYFEFTHFINKGGMAQEMTLEDFKVNVIDRFCNNEGSLNFRGFVQFFTDFVTVNGEEAGFKLIRGQGYD